MIDRNNNISVDDVKAKEASDALKDWLETHTDPNKNPWTDDSWRRESDVDSENCIYSDPTVGREDDEDCVIVLGSRDDQGRLEGNVSLRWSNGDSFQGCYKDGQRSGWGIVASPCHDILALTGDWSQGWLEGRGRLVTKNTTVLEAWFHRSCLHGPVRKIEMKKFRMFKQQVTFLGQYHHGRCVGQCWQWCEGGGWLTGQVDTKGDMTGDNVAFVYPDLSTCLHGQYEQGVAVSVRPGVVASVTMDNDIVTPHMVATSPVSVTHSVSTVSSVGPGPLIADPYESRTCEVRSSEVEGGGDGLFTVRNIRKGEIVAFYNGVRLPYVPGEKENWESSGYKIFVNADHSSGERIDLPGDLIHTTNYCATLGHKMNHNFDYNCSEWFFDHPRHGTIPCAVAITDIPAGSELFLHYGYDPNNCPLWYKEAVDQYLREHPDVDLWNVIDPNRLEKDKPKWKEENY